jgi:hypothetical protein
MSLLSTVDSRTVGRRGTLVPGRSGGRPAFCSRAIRSDMVISSSSVPVTAAERRRPWAHIRLDEITAVYPEGSRDVPGGYGLLQMD